MIRYLWAMTLLATFVFKDVLLVNAFSAYIHASWLKYSSNTSNALAAYSSKINQTYIHLTKYFQHNTLINYLGKKYNEYTKNCEQKTLLLLLPLLNNTISAAILKILKSLIDFTGSIAIRAPSLF
ncbi:MAG: hypothetical protein ACRC6X_06945 [Culicoidibacterales bacterium]